MTQTSNSGCVGVSSGSGCACADLITEESGRLRHFGLVFLPVENTVFCFKLQIGSEPQQELE